MGEQGEISLHEDGSVFVDEKGRVILFDSWGSNCCCELDDDGGGDDGGGPSPCFPCERYLHPYEGYPLWWPKTNCTCIDYGPGPGEVDYPCWNDPDQTAQVTYPLGPEWSPIKFHLWSLCRYYGWGWDPDAPFKFTYPKQAWNDPTREWTEWNYDWGGLGWTPDFLPASWYGHEPLHCGQEPWVGGTYPYGRLRSYVPAYVVLRTFAAGYFKVTFYENELGGGGLYTPPVWVGRWEVLQTGTIGELASGDFVQMETKFRIKTPRTGGSEFYVNDVLVATSASAEWFDCVGVGPCTAGTVGLPWNDAAGNTLYGAPHFLVLTDVPVGCFTY